MSQVWFKSRENRTEFTYGRKTSIEEEWTALNRLYSAFPGYFPEPYNLSKDAGSVKGYEMEFLDLETKLEYTIMEDYSTTTVASFVKELEDVVYTINERPDLPPHGDLIGNVWITSEDSLKIIDPRGIPKDEVEETSWSREEQEQINWIKESLEQN